MAISVHSAVCLLFLMIFSTVTPGFSLYVELTAEREIVCPDDETVSYTCAVTTPEVQWIVEPFIPASGDVLTFGNAPGSIGRTDRRTGVVVEHVSINPLLTRLTIDTRVITSPVNVTCFTLGLTPAETSSTLEYYPADGLSVEPVSHVNATPIVNAMTNGSILVKFVPSPSLRITNYVINLCINGSCTPTMIGAMEDDAIVEAISGRSYNVCVHAVNRCGNESRMECDEVQIPTLFTVFSIDRPMESSMISTSIFAGVVATLLVVTAVLLLVLAVWILYHICVKEKKSQNSTAPDSAIPLEGGDESSGKL